MGSPNSGLRGMGCGCQPLKEIGIVSSSVVGLGELGVGVTGDGSVGPGASVGVGVVDIVEVVQSSGLSGGRCDLSRSDCRDTNVRKVASEDERPKQGSGAWTWRGKCKTGQGKARASAPGADAAELS